MSFRYYTVVMSMAKTSLPDLTTIAADFPGVKFEPHHQFYWSASKSTVFYNADELDNHAGMSHLLHELGHALCDHQVFTSGIGLVRLEAEAWDKAAELAKKYDTTISERLKDYCMNSYRDWLHLRSKCPECGAHGAETDQNKYKCFNCFTSWRVPCDQRKRNYRRLEAGS
jgi:hypothetical protein